ncbi:hypothetical protein [Acetobacter sp. DsW_059]|uniref:hypothetical protein n=1 Tax=Acetobacter sp. DsW_059 TaxID=1670661 RepID=UPI000A3AB582|nr:hypothetical protein [Acetobacter sp. DsW_059]
MVADLSEAGRLWHTLDGLASEHGFTPSGLARAAGLDPTTFNPSRRRNAKGDYRWPSLSSLFSALSVLRLSLSEFADAFDKRQVARPVPVEGGVFLPALPLSRLHEEGVFDHTGLPRTIMWESVVLPGVFAPSAYVVRVDTDMYEPVMREESLIVVVPDLPPRRHDRVLCSQIGRPSVAGLWSPGAPGAVLPFFAGQSEQESDELSAVSGGAEIWVHRIITVTF